MEGQKESLLELDITLSYMNDHNDILSELLYDLNPRTLLHLTLAYVGLNTTVMQRISNVKCTLDLVNSRRIPRGFWPIITPIRRGEVDVLSRKPLRYVTAARRSFYESELQLFRALGKCKEFVFWNMRATRAVFMVIAQIGSWAKLDQVKIVKQEQQPEKGITMKWNDFIGSEDYRKLLGCPLLQIVVTIED